MADSVSFSEALSAFLIFIYSILSFILGATRRLVLLAFGGVEDFLQFGDLVFERF